MCDFLEPIPGGINWVQTGDLLLPRPTLYPLKQLIQHRGIVIVFNMLNSDNDELAKKLIESEMLEILSVIGKAEDNPKRQEVIDAGRACLVKAMDLGFIKPFNSPS